MSIIELKNVSFSYNKDTDEQIDAVKDVSLSINEGDFVALVGHNGSGKSTIARLLNGLLLPDKGSVCVDGKFTAVQKKLFDNKSALGKRLDPGNQIEFIDEKGQSKLFDIRSILGIVFQNPDNQMVATIIEDDVAFGPENLGLKSEEIRKRVDWALNSVGMYEYREGTPFRLSGGQKQRVAIAGVLAIKPKIMVLDEATSMLDPTGRREVLDVISRLNKDEKMTVVMITHFMDEAVLADRIIVMNNGEIMLDGGAEIFKEEEKICNAGLELPSAARLAAALRERGIDTPRGLTSIKQLADVLT